MDGAACVVGRLPGVSGKVEQSGADRHGEQFARPGDVGGAGAAGQQPIVADAVSALRVLQTVSRCFRKPFKCLYAIDISSNVRLLTFPIVS